MQRFTVTMQPLARERWLLVRAGSDKLMRAILRPVTANHPHTAATQLLAGLPLCRPQAQSFVLCADAQASSSATRKFDDVVGFGVKTVHDDVEVALRAHPRAGRDRRIRGGLANFADLRQRCLEGVTS
ncbi:MAG TPA: hypothetical protein VHI75_01655 [Casimicrobiaceae bacterium]|nr:hypothetical protein [Casimicrobiaceae bacterium]